MKLNTLTQLENSDLLRQQTVIVRVDYNVPLQEENGELAVSDDTRIKNSRATIDWLRQRGNKVVLFSHLGRPKGEYEAKYSLRPVANYLKQSGWWPSEEIHFEERLGDFAATQRYVDSLPAGSVVLMENVRFYPGEKTNDPELARQMASLGQAFVNEAFASSHRAHASVVGIAQLLPSYAGLALEAEIAALQAVIDEPQRPLVVVVGGAKISDKVGAVANLARVADVVLVGGGVANNFIKAEGVETHHSYMEDAPADLSKEGKDYVALAKEIINANTFERFLKDGYIPLSKIVYPFDVIVARNGDSEETEIFNLDRAMADTEPDQELMYLDIGPKTTRLYQEIILAAGTVFWNGPMGMFEKPPFRSGTAEVARAVAKTSAVTVVGGGDTIAAVKENDYEGRIDFISTGGSAGLEFLAGKTLPGLAVLAER